MQRCICTPMKPMDVTCLTGVSVHQLIMLCWCVQLQPPEPALQLPLPLRPPPSTPRAVACEVHEKMLDMVELAEAPKTERAKIDFLLCQGVTEVSHHHAHATEKKEGFCKLLPANKIGRFCQLWQSVHIFMTPGWEVLLQVPSCVTVSLTLSKTLVSN